MKLTSVEIHPENSSDIAIFSFRDPNANNPYNVKNITGLDADEIVPKSYSGAGSFKFYNLSLLNREIVLKIGLNPSFVDQKSYSDLRDDLYRMIASSRTGKIQIQFKRRTDIIAAVTGYISKFNNALFERTQDVEISVKCDEPLLRAPTPVMISDLNPSRSNVQDEESTAPHGFSFNLKVTDAIDSLIITDPFNDNWNFEIIPVDGFLADDQLFFSSEYNDKQLYIIRDDDTIHLADVIVPGSVWPIMFPGNNTFEFSNPESLDWNSLSYYPTYWGV